MKISLLATLALTSAGAAPVSNLNLPTPGAAAPERVATAANSAAEVRAVSLLNALNSRSPTPIRAFVERSFSMDALRKESAEDRADDMLRAASTIRRGTVLRWENTSETRGRLVFRNDLLGRVQAIGIRVDSDPPYAIAGWSPPQDLPSQVTPVATDSQVALGLGRFVKRLAKYGYFSGTILVKHDDKTVLIGVYGLADRNFDIPNRRDTKFQLASMTKMLTAVAIGQLMESGKLSLDDSLSKFVPDVPGGDKIQIKHLLSHTAGIGDLFDKTDFFDRNPSKFREISDYLRTVDRSQPRADPGTTWAYSNLGYLYLGRVIEVASGEEYHDYIQKHVFGPAGMANSGFWDLDYPVQHMAYPYEYTFVRNKGGYRNMNGQLGVRGMPFGGAISTLDDMDRFGRALFGGALLSPDSVRTFTTPKPELHSPFYGYGFFSKTYPNSNVVQFGHGGNIKGGCTQFSVLKRGGASWKLVILSNGGLTNCAILFDEASRLIVERLSSH